MIYPTQYCVLSPGPPTDSLNVFGGADTMGLPRLPSGAVVDTQQYLNGDGP